jgi:hypothetical protein
LRCWTGRPPWRRGLRFFGNTANRQAQLTAARSGRALFGFPAAGGTRDGSVIRYVLIRQQKAMLGERDGTTTARIQHLGGMLNGHNGIRWRSSTPNGLGLAPGRRYSGGEDSAYHAEQHP